MQWSKRSAISAKEYIFSVYHRCSNRLNKNQATDSTGIDDTRSSSSNAITYDSFIFASFLHFAHSLTQNCFSFCWNCVLKQQSSQRHFKWIDIFALVAPSLVVKLNRFFQLILENMENVLLKDQNNEKRKGKLRKVVSHQRQMELAKYIKRIIVEWPFAHRRKGNKKA